MKKFLAVILVLATLFSMCAPLSGCSSITPLQMGSWLSLIAQSFGMSEFTSDQPYFARVGAEDTYFGAFQLAAEWDILEPSETVSSSTAVTWRDVLVTLVNAGNFLDADATEEEKIQFAISNFDPEIRTYWMKRNIQMTEAIPLLDKAAQMWTDHTYTESIEDISLGEDVVSFLNEEDFQYIEDGNTVTMDASYAQGLKPGDYYALPSVKGVSQSSLNKVESVEIVDGVAVITNDPTVTEQEISDQIESMRIVDTEMIDFSDITAIYDGAGNPIYLAPQGGASQTSASGDDFSGVHVTTLDNRTGGDIQASNVGLFDSVVGKPITFEVNGYEAKLVFQSHGVSLTLSHKTTKDSKYRDMVETTYVTAALDNVLLTKDVDFKWGKLDHAFLALNYDSSLTGGIKYAEVNKVGTQLEPGQQKRTHLSTVISGYANAIGNLKKQVYETKYSNKSIYICRITIAGTKAAGVDFFMKGKVTASGALEITLSMGGTQGIEYKNGNIRCVSSTRPGASMVAEGNFELTIGAGLEIRVFKTQIGNVMIEAGVGAQFKYTAHLLDEEWHLLYSSDTVMSASDANEMENLLYQTTAEDILAVAESEGGTWKGFQAGATVNILSRACIEWGLYPIVTISGEITPLSKSASFSLFNKDKILLHGHIDIPNSLSDALAAESFGQSLLTMLGVNQECHYKFKPWDTEEGETEETTEGTTETTEETQESDPILTSDAIMLSNIRIFLDKNQSAELRVTGLPKGYTINDLVAKTENASIASVDIAAGRVYAGETAGTVQITISTSDGKFTAFCAVTVADDAPQGFVGLSMRVPGEETAL